ncbi:iron-containing alcohol dehydrogenase [Virgibacillus ndiopensis]|uniref:iron-containing alcohol dehydrogenase n=1 Tax=Virgibacillus ndiopensis TaxID=2004408 RepID=UPI000C080D52|nr:iron-containing alcohol dehydrogenase [Virgibacillus ndiopensis]
MFNLVQHIHTKYGKLLITKETINLQRYIIITMEIPWNLGKQFFEDNPPEQVILVDTLDKEKLDEISKTLIDNVEIVGLGGGTAIDAAKYFAYQHGKIPLLVPSITSTNAPFSDFISIKRNGSAFGFKVDGYPKRILVDYELIRLSEPRYNRAGYGDFLYLQTTLNDWMIASQKGLTKDVDQEIKEQIVQLVDSMTKRADEIGEMTEQGVHLLMENIKNSAELYILHPDKPISAGSEHLFAWNLELVTGKTYVHGEIVALGIVIASFLQQFYMKDSRYHMLLKAFDDASVLYRPDILGISWEEIEETLLTVETYNRKVRNFHTVFEFIDWTPELLDQLKRYLSL